jgi:hypothetical protein
VGAPAERRSTPRKWLDLPPVKWGLFTGGYLGSGVLTRIGVSMWFLIPALTLMSGSIIAGVVAFAVYGMARVTLTTTLIRESPSRLRSDRPGWWPDGRVVHKASAYTVMSVALVILGLIASGKVTA